MGQKKVFRIFSLVILAITLVFIILGISGKGKITPPPEFEADGQKMVSIRFNEENRRVLEVQCSESERESNDKILMKKIKATVFQKGKIKSDIVIMGDNGVVENNFHNFTISNKARIKSKDLLAKCSSFSILNQESVATEEKVDYRVKFLEGIAKKGMRLNIKKNLLFLYETNGTYKKEEKFFNYKASFLRFDDNERTMRMRDNCKINNEETILRGNRILLGFNEGYEDATEISSWGNCYLYIGEQSGEPGKSKEFKEAKASHIRNLYNEGNLKHTRLEKKVKVKLRTKANTTNIYSNEIEIRYNEKNGNIKSINLPKLSNVKNTGQNNFKGKANRMDLEYNKKGEMSLCKSRGESIFIIDDYKGISFLMVYDIEKKSVNLKGKGSKVVYKQNAFESSAFNVNTKEKKMVSTEGVLSIIQLDMEKNNVLFSKDLIYINSKKIEVLNKEGRFTYEENVDLRQKDTLLTADKLTIDEDNNLVASGNAVSLSFKNKEDSVRIKGKEIVFDAKNRKIEVQKGIVESTGNILKAALLKMDFSKENEIDEIIGEGKIDFIKEEDDISGSSEKVKWLFTRDEILFIDSAQIRRKDRGTTKGKELRFFLKDNRITISSDESKRTETTIENKDKDKDKE